MWLSTPISAKYLPALQRALVWQALFICFSAMMLDHYYTNHVVVVAAVAHWIAIGMIFIRRPASPTSVDLFVCRAYPLLFGIAMLLAPKIMGGFMGGPKHRTLLDRWLGVELLQDGDPAGLLFAIAALILAVVLSFTNRKSQVDQSILRAEVLKFISIGMPIENARRIMEENGFEEAALDQEPAGTGSRLVFKTVHGTSEPASGEIGVAIYHDDEKVTDVKVTTTP